MDAGVSRAITTMINKNHSFSVLKLLIVGGAVIPTIVGLSSAAEPAGPPPAGYAPDTPGWIAFGLTGAAILIAWLLNHGQPKVRALGTGLAGLACFGIVGWFATALETGVLADPKPFQAPMDVMKPFLLWAQASTALVGGLVLVSLAVRQFRNGKLLTLSNANEATRYGRVSRILHWTTAILFISLIPMGIFLSMIPELAWYRSDYARVHETIGVIILGLFVARMLWNRHSKRPALDPSLKSLEHKMAHRAHLFLYFLMFAVPITGFAMTTLHGFPLMFFTLNFEMPWAENWTYQLRGLFHKYILQYLIYLVLGAHVLGALKHQFIDKHDSAFKRMVS